ncbi:DUF1912 family protein [Streptococcus constellatus]
MTYEQEFLQEFEAWVKTQVMTKISTTFRI